MKKLLTGILMTGVCIGAAAFSVKLIAYFAAKGWYEGTRDAGAQTQTINVHWDESSIRAIHEIIGAAK